MPLLTWYGHACFGLDFGAGGSVIFDPYEKGSVPGAELPESLSADCVLCSHEHHDHNARDRVSLTGEAHKLAVTFLDSWHDEAQGAKRGPIRIALVEYGGFRAAHLGDLGCELAPQQLSALSGLDLLLLPVGGCFTIGPREAKALADALRPKALVPMHYRRGDMGFPVLNDLADFTGLFDGYTELPGCQLTLPTETGGLYVLNLK